MSEHGLPNVLLTNQVQKAVQDVLTHSQMWKLRFHKLSILLRITQLQVVEAGFLKSIVTKNVAATGQCREDLLGDRKKSRWIRRKDEYG